MHLVDAAADAASQHAEQMTEFARGHEESARVLARIIERLAIAYGDPILLSDDGQIVRHYLSERG